MRQSVIDEVEDFTVKPIRGAVGVDELVHRDAVSEREDCGGESFGGVGQRDASRVVPCLEGSGKSLGKVLLALVEGVSQARVTDGGCPVLEQQHHQRRLLGDQTRESLADRGFAPTGRPLSISGVDEWTFRGELLCGYRTYYDTLDAARQLGIMPASGSRAERTMARLQHIQARVRGDAVSSISMLRWQLWYAGWQHGSVDPDPDRPVFVSLTDFRIHRPWHAPSAWRSGLRLRRSWPRLEGAIGLWLWAEPVKLRSGSVSIWRTQEDLMRFLRSPVHRAIVARYRTRMSGTSSGWTAPRLDRGEIWSQAIHILTKQQTPARESNRLA